MHFFVLHRKIYLADMRKEIYASYNVKRHTVYFVGGEKNANI